MAERMSRAAMIAAGIALLAATFGYLLFWRTVPFEAMTADFRPLMTARSVAQIEADVQGLEAAAAEYRTALIPTITARTGSSVDALRARLARQYPAVTSGMDQIPRIAAGMRSLAATFESERVRFAAADAIPSKGITTTAIPWLLTIAAAIAIVAGLSAAGSRGTAIAAVVAGVMLAAAPLLLSMPSKAAAADRLNDNLAPLFNTGRIVQTEQAVDILQAMAAELTTTMLPQISARLGLPPEQITPFFAQNFPALTAMVQTAPEALARAEAIAHVHAGNQARYEDIRPVSFRVLTWTSLGAGLTLIVAGSVASGRAARIAAFEPGEGRRPGRRRVAA
ncbi:MAG TPA: hypothetical protein VM841_12865 [Actinomycetota bacterium]|nr:hypothetical protein [Actinomycetota bacterium]